MAERTSPRRATDAVEAVVGRLLAVLAVVAGAPAVSIGFAVHAEVVRQADVQARTPVPVAAATVGPTSGTTLAGTVRPPVPASDMWATDGPVRRSDAVLCGVVAGIAAAGLAGAALWLGWWLVRRATLALNARRWADEWAAVEPHWRQELR